MSKFSKSYGNTTLLICFGSMNLNNLGEEKSNTDDTSFIHTPVDFFIYLTNIFKNRIDITFYVDRYNCYYHKGIKGITKNIDETVEHLKDKIKNYKNVIFMGALDGGYASILFGSLCKINYVISFIPKINLAHLIDSSYISIIEERYKDIKGIINGKSTYFIYYYPNVEDKDNDISVYGKYSNVNLIVMDESGLENDTIKNILENII